MIILPKSEAELALQFLDTPPDDVILPGDMHERYVDSYIAMSESFMNGSVAESVETLRGLEEKNDDVINYRGSFSYVAALRTARQSEQLRFTTTLSNAAISDQDPTVTEKRKELLRGYTIDLADTDDVLVRSLFPSGNYFLHSTTADRIVGILSSGEIKSTAGIEDHDKRQELSNGGALGVSGNFNTVSNLLGDSKHIAGFVADPYSVLVSQGGYFSVPAKSCWNELQYFGGNPKEIMATRRIETHLEITRGMFEELNSYMEALQNPEMPVEIKYQILNGFSDAMEHLADNPMNAMRATRQDKEGNLWFTDMLGNDGEPVTPFAVIVSAVLNGDYGEELAQSVRDSNPKQVSEKLIRILEPLFVNIGTRLDELMDTQGVEIGKKSSIKVEDTLFYCPKKDYEKWLAVLAVMPFQPLGVVVYNDSEVRTPTAFASLLPDNSMGALSAQLESLKSNRQIDWRSIFSSDDQPVASNLTHYLVRPRETGLAGIVAINDDELKVKSLDDIYD